MTNTTSNEAQVDPRSVLDVIRQRADRVAALRDRDVREGIRAAYEVASASDVPRLVAALTAALDARDVIVQGIGHEVYAAGSIDPEECTEECPACAIDEMYAVIEAALTEEEK